MDLTGLDIAYIREVGEDVRARLFPKPKQVLDPVRGEYVDGPPPVPMPVLLDYHHEEVGTNIPSMVVEVIFVPDRSLQYVTDSVAPDVDPSSVFVIYDGELLGGCRQNLVFGEVPEVVTIDGSSMDSDPANALLRAITGTL